METNYTKRPLWHWILLYIVIAAVVYGLIYYFKSNKAELSAADAQTLETITSLTPEITWQEPTPGKEEHFGLPGNPVLHGTEITGTTNTTVDFFSKTHPALTEQGWTDDTSLAADGVGDSFSGYKKMVDGKYQYLISKTHIDFGTPASEEAPPGCPCKYSYKIFLSENQE